MNRNQFLKSAAAVSTASLFSLGRIHKAQARAARARFELEAGCVLIPTEEAGPYVLDLSEDQTMFRQDITEGNPGTPLNITLSLVNLNDNCSPIVSARVDIWHCNKDGYYSEFGNQPGYQGTQSYVGQTFFRGIQLSDAQGQVNFTTIYPGWYGGRVTHIHAQIFLSSLLSATTQIAFPDSTNTSVYNTSLYQGHGQNTLTNQTDSVFSDAANTQYETFTLAPNSTTGGYDAALTIGIAAPKSGVVNLAPETGGQFTLGQNAPNPVSFSATIPLTLAARSLVRLELFDLTGQRVAYVLNNTMEAGSQPIKLDRTEIPLSSGSYVYQLTVQNENGTFRQCKLMTIE